MGLFLLHFSAAGQTRHIRLRNETIPTTPAVKLAPAGQFQALGLSANSPASGLFLVQFESPPGPAQRAELRARGVELLKYVPDGAFVARFSNVSPEQVGALDYVRWVGPYRAEHKIHPQLSAAARTAVPPASLGAVNVLVAPGATVSELAAVRSLLSPVQHESGLRQGTIVRGSLNPGRLRRLAESSAVLWIERAAKRKLVDEAAAKVVGGDDGNTGTRTVTQQLGFDGRGVTVCVADTGLDTGNKTTMHPDLRGRVTGFRYYGSVTDASDGYGHGTHVAGIVAGNAATGETDPDTGAFYGLGVAPGASLFCERMFDSEGSEVNPPPSDADLTRDAVRAGAQIGANSWGIDLQGEYDLEAAQFDELVRDADDGVAGDQPYILEFSAGNAGPDSETIGTPGSGKNVLTTGATENVPGLLAMSYGLYASGPDTIADFSSRGPCQDGRIKPDVVAPGTWIASAASAAALNEAAIAWTVIDDYYVYMGGTSMSGPAAAGAAAVFVQYYKSLHSNAVPSPALVKAALINSAVEMDHANGGPGPIPNNDEGWGRVDLTQLIVTNLESALRYYQYLDQAVLLSSSQVYTQHVLVQSPDQPLKITLAYTDVAGFAGAIPALVNDLDLEVVGPDGTVYRGNQFSGGESVPNAPLTDSLNNAEGVHLASPLPGDYIVRVRAFNVVEDARRDTAAIDQDFALVVSGNLARPNGGFILLDRPTYTAPGVMQIEVIDLARAGSNSVSVHVQSTTEAGGETYALLAAGSYGLFTGAVATAVGPAVVDGQLEIRHGDVIRAEYVDNSGNARVATAVADLIPPVLTGVAVTLDLGVITFTWQSSEPANSIICYGTNLSFNLAITNATVATGHSLRLDKLVAGATYYFYVVSADAAGNAVTNDNGGAYYSFVGVAPPTVLLVDDYDTAGESEAGATVIPDNTYTDALAAAGISYGFWKVNQRGYPQLSDLVVFPAVLWRTTDDVVYYEGTHNTLTAPQQLMIQNYLDGGGSFCMASMSILSQLGDVPFRRNGLQVARFKQNPSPPMACQNCDEDFGVPAIAGAAGHPLWDGLSVTLDYTNYPSFEVDTDFVLGPDFSDTFTPATNATPICYEPVSGKVCGMSYPRAGQSSPGRVVFLSFPLDSVPPSGPAANNRAGFLRKIVNFLAPGANGVGTISLDHTIYTAPDQVSVEVGDSDLAGAGQTQATFSSSSSTNRLAVTLNETAHPGLFLGYITLAATNAATNELSVCNGDTIRAEYTDVSNGRNAVTVATVDATAPQVSGVTAVVGTENAVVSWKTSKPADSLVQFGDPLLLGRTAYAPSLTTNHAVTLTGLFANRDYFYQVTSRDAAGNTTVDNNQDALYMFTTARAPQPPWFDDLERGASDWVVVPDPDNGSEMNWALGTPNNGLQTRAHSGTNAWGSDINGEAFNLFASSFLYSPVIDLSDVSEATLTFRHCADFNSMYELGQLGVSTNSSTPPAEIPTLVDYTGLFAPNWEEEVVDLTAFAGQTIRVVWYYQGLNLDLGPLYGWLVDDVQITGVAASSNGTIVISKNLGQGSFTLTGPLSRSGQAPSTIISNAPSGEYTLRFSDVTYYQTPLDQTNSLASGGTLTFTGNYGFLDVNHNGISDAWERYYFGTADTNRTQWTDTDGDGMPDYAEFIAGTDPTDPASKLTLLSITVQTNQFAQWQWTASPGRLYQAESSTNLAGWTPVADWLQATGNTMSGSEINLDRGPHYYRVQVRP